MKDHPTSSYLDEIDPDEKIAFVEADYEQKAF